MKSLLLEADVNLIIGLVIFVIAIVVAIALALRLNKKISNTTEKIDWKKYNYKGQLKKHVPVLWPKELEFYYMFRSVLPKEFMIIPKLGVDEIIKPNGGNLVLFNTVKDAHVDFCIVKVSTMEPVAVLDTFYPSITDSTLQEIEYPVKKALESCDIPVIVYEILDIPYDRDQVLKKFLNAIDPVIIANMRNENK